MKKYFIIGFLLIFTLSVFGQRPATKQINSAGSYNFYGSVAKGDTINKDASLNYVYYCPSLFNTMQSQVLTDTVTGKPKVRLYIYQSFDGVNWVYADSATTITGGAIGRTTKTTVFAPYSKLIVKAIDSTQKTVILKVITNLNVN
jgi:hypothetical protein